MKRLLLSVLAILALFANPVVAGAAQSTCAQSAVPAQNMSAIGDAVPEASKLTPCHDQTRRGAKNKAVNCAQACAALCGVLAGLPPIADLAVPRLSEAEPLQTLRALLPSHHPGGLKRPPRVLA